MTKSANLLNNDINKISTWASQWKMNFNQDPTKQAQEVTFSQKLQNTNHPCFIFNHNPFSLTESHKHLGIALNSGLDFREHLEITFKLVSKTIGFLHKLQNLLPRISLTTVYKSFIIPHMDYVGIIYDQAYNASFLRKLESIQYNAALATTGAIRGKYFKKKKKKNSIRSLALNLCNRDVV